MKKWLTLYTTAPSRPSANERRANEIRQQVGGWSGVIVGFIDEPMEVSHCLCVGGSGGSKWVASTNNYRDRSSGHSKPRPSPAKYILPVLVLIIILFRGQLKISCGVSSLSWLLGLFILNLLLVNESPCLNCVVSFERDSGLVAGHKLLWTISDLLVLSFPPPS